MASTNNTVFDVSTAGSPVIIQKKRIHKKKPVELVETQTPVENTTFVSETDIDNLSTGMSVLTLEEPVQEKKKKTVKKVKEPAVKETDEDSVSSKGTRVLEKKPTKKVAKKQQVVDESSVATGEAESTPPVVEKKTKAPKKSKAVEVAPEVPVNTTVVIAPEVPENATTVVVEPTTEKPAKKARAPKKPKAVEVVPEPLENTTAVAETTDVAEKPAKKTKAPKKPKAVEVVSEPLENTTVVAETTDVAEKKAKAPRKPKVAENGAPVEKKEKVIRKKAPTEKQVKLHGPDAPNTVGQFFHILKSFIKQTSRYTALAEKPDGTVYPIFLKITGEFNEEKGAYPCEFYKDTVSENEQTGEIVSKPVWTSVLEKGEITMTECFNILPFDKDFTYVYLKSLKKPEEEPEQENAK